MILEKFEKQPRERKDYDINYAPWLVPINDTLDDVVVVSVVCLTDATDTTLIVDAPQITLTRAKCWISGGTHNHKYKISLLATTVGTRIDESELLFTVKDI